MNLFLSCDFFLYTGELRLCSVSLKFFTHPLKNGCVLFLLRSYPAGADAGYCFLLVSAFFLYHAGAAAGSCFLLVILPAQPQDIVSYSFPLSLSCRRSRRILFSSRFLFLYPAGAAAGSCI